jgi:hypothetical protein
LVLSKLESNPLVYLTGCLHDLCIDRRNTCRYMLLLCRYQHKRASGTGMRKVHHTVLANNERLADCTTRNAIACSLGYYSVWYDLGSNGCVGRWCHK